MKKDDIVNAVKSRLAGGVTGVNFDFPNVKPSDTSRPIVEMVAGTALGDVQTLKGGEITREEATYLLNVVVEQGTGETAANNIADVIKALFPSGLKLTIPGGALYFRFPSEIRAGFKRDSDDWVVPVFVRYVAIAD